MCKPKKNLRDSDRLCFVCDQPYVKVLSFLKELPSDVYDAVYCAFSRFLLKYQISPSYDPYKLADEFRYWNVGCLSWWNGKSGIGVRFSFNSYQVLDL